MATTGSDPRTNFPREFTECPSCGRRGLMALKGTVVRGADGRLGGFPPRHRCKFCHHVAWDLDPDEYRRRLNEVRPPAGIGFETLTKRQLLFVLEHVPQHFWPPRPTRQDKETIKWAVVRAQQSGRYVFDLSHARDPLEVSEEPR